jgi:uncharacterized protein (DUF488 family)
MNKSTIYSIGHGNKKIEMFINELVSYDILYLVDVRSRPFSKWNPQFNQDALKIDLKNNGINYLFLGDKLGGLPKDKSCYVNGKVDYNIIKEKDFFKESLERLVNANTKRIKIAIMCSEAKPEECHRTKLIGEELRRKNISTNHISNKLLKLQETVMLELTEGKGIIDLFGNEIAFTSRKSYG